MNSRTKLLERMRNNPKGDWTIADLKSLALYYGLTHSQPGTSHVTFRSNDGRKLTVPAARSIKPIYIKLFINFVENM